MDSLFKVVMCGHCGRSSVKEIRNLKGTRLRCPYCDKATSLKKAKIMGVFGNARDAQNRCMKVNTPQQKCL